nr:hypothetical protein [Tanacetum cinerariifolium]
MLNQDNYVPLSSHLLHYAKSKPNAKSTYEQTDDELTDQEVKQMEADDRAIHTILRDLPEDIYVVVDSCQTAKEIWLRVEQMMKGPTIGAQEKKAKLFNEWEKFKSTKRESIESNQVGQYAGQIARNHNAVQNVKNRVVHNAVQNLGVQDVGNQNGLIVVPGIDPPITNLNVNQHGNGNVVAARAKVNENRNNGDIDKIEEVNANCILMANLQQASTLGIQIGKAPIYDLDGSSEHDPPAVYDSEEILQLAQDSRLKMKQLNKDIKLINYVKINELSEVFASQKAKSCEVVYFSNTSKMASVSKSFSIPNEEYLDDTLSVTKKFLNEVKDTLVTLQRVVKHRMNGNITNLSSSTHQEIHKIFKDEIIPLINQSDARVQNFENHFVKEAAKFVRDFTSLAKKADDSLDKIKALEFENKRLLKAFVSQDIMSVVQNNSIVDTPNLQIKLDLVESTAKTKRPQPRSNTKNDMVPSASTSSCLKNKEVKVEEHHMTLLLFKNKKHMSSECNNVKAAIQIAKSEVVCAMCKQCLITANHDACMLNYVNDMNSHGKKQKANVSNVTNQTKFKPKVRKPNKKFLGTVHFRNDHVAAILGYGNIQWGNILIARVYFIEGLGHNLFSVGQFCDLDFEIEADDQAIQTILLSLPENIYAAVDSCETAQEIWLQVQQMMKGSNIGIQEKKAKNKHFPEKIASNLKFLNNLQPEWSRHVTIVHHTKDLHTADYTQLYDFLKYNQKEVDELKAERLAKIHDPLALMANSNNPYASPALHQDLSPLNQNYLQQSMPNPEDITDSTTAMNMALALMAKAFKLNYSTLTNKNQRISSNPRNRQIAQPGMNMGQDRQMQMIGEEYDLMAATADLDEIKEVNANCILMANLQQASSSGTQTDKDPVYDSDGSAEVIQIYLWCVDSGCSKHMTGNQKLLINFVWKFMGTVRFGNDHVAAIMGFEFKNQMLQEYFDSIGISHQSSSVRTPQQNGVALGYPKNDREDLGKLGAKGDIGFFIGYFANSCTYIVYNRRTKKIMETMNVTSDELSAMDFEQPIYDDYIGCQPSAAPRTAPATPAPQQQDDQAPLQPETVAYYVSNVMLDGNTFVNPFATPSIDSAESSSHYVDLSNMHTFYQPYPHKYQWTKDNPLEKVIGEPSRLVLTRNQLQINGDMCMCALTVYVHDIILGSTNPRYTQLFADLMKSCFEISVMGEMNFFLGLQVNQSPYGIFINQSSYMLEILKKYEMETCDPVETPIEIKDKLDLDKNRTLVYATKYHSMIAALMYLTSSRPDIVHTTCLCTRYQTKTTEKHLKEVKMIFCYLQGTINMGLWYMKDSGFELTGFLDADYVVCKDTFKSTFGGL